MDKMGMAHLANKAEDAVVALRSHGADKVGSPLRGAYDVVLGLRDELDAGIGGFDQRGAWCDLDGLLILAQANGAKHPEDSAEGLDYVALCAAVERRDWSAAVRHASPFLTELQWLGIREFAATLGLPLELGPEPAVRPSWSASDAAGS